jgi:predicted O-methyltransferase YrrM
MNVPDIKGYTPEHALDLQGWHGNFPVFEELIAELKPKTIIEVGSWKGQSTTSMAQACKKLGLRSKIYCVDTWLGADEFWPGTPDHNLYLKYGYPSVYYRFLSNVYHCGVQDIIVPVPMPSKMGARYLKKNNVIADLIYIDGSHEYEDVISDIDSYLPLVRKGGIFFGDDYYGWPGVAKAVDEKFSKFDIRPADFWICRI